MFSRRCSFPSGLASARVKPSPSTRPARDRPAGRTVFGDVLAAPLRQAVLNRTQNDPVTLNVARFSTATPLDDPDELYRVYVYSSPAVSHCRTRQDRLAPPVNTSVFGLFEAFPAPVNSFWL